jgi:large subunit ribosomal protein L13
MKSVTSIKQSEITEKWYVVNAEGARIGRIATIVAELLLGKNDPLVRAYHKPMSKVIITNAEKIDFTEKKGLTKFYKNYSGFPDGLKFEALRELFLRNPAKPLTTAVRGMLPKTKRGREMIANLRVYPGATHQHEAQSPVVINLRDAKF